MIINQIVELLHVVNKIVCLYVCMYVPYTNLNAEAILTKICPLQSGNKQSRGETRILRSDGILTQSGCWEYFLAAVGLIGNFVFYTHVLS